MFGFGEEAHLVAAGDSAVAEDPLVAREVRAVDDEQLMLVELDFLWHSRIEDRDAGAAIVDQEILVVPENALEDRHVDMFAVKVGVLAGTMAMARLEHHVDHGAEFLDQFEESVEHPLAGDRGHQDGDFVLPFLVAVDIVTIPCRRDDLEVERRANRLGQGELAVAGHLEMGFELAIARLGKAARRGGSHARGAVLLEHIVEKTLEEPHRSVSRQIKLGGGT